MKRRFLVITILLFLLTGCTLAEMAHPTTGEISGKVIYPSDGSPIPFANVVTEPPTSSVTTDDEGKYSITRVRPGTYTVMASKQNSTSRRVRVAVEAGENTTADLHLVPVLTMTTPPSGPAPTATDVNTPGFSGSNLLANGNLDENDFGVIANWANTNIDLYRWYLVQDIRPGKGTENTRWVERVELFEYDRGYGLKSTDHQNCNYFCSTSAVQIVPAQENKVYKLSAEAMRAEGRGGKIYIDFLNANRARINPHSKGGYSEEWSRQENTAIAPEGTRYIRVILYTDNRDQGIVYWDNVQLLESE